MPNYRVPKDYFFGTLTANAALSDTSLVSAEFAALSTSYGADWVLPLTLHDPVLKVYEVVWVTGHASSSTTVTVLRGKEGTAARAWPSGTQVLCAPTQRDGLLPLTRANLPADRHTGQRVPLSDEGIVVQSTLDQGWQADVGVAVPSDFGLKLGGGAITSWKVIVARGNRVTGTTDASGRIAATYTAPFPTETLRVIPVWVSGGSGSLVVAIDPAVPATSSGFTAYFYNPVTGSVSSAGVSVTFDYIALGF